ncbi:unnamed protein product [Lota lota]
MFSSVGARRAADASLETVTEPRGGNSGSEEVLEERLNGTDGVTLTPGAHKTPAAPGSTFPRPGPAKRHAPDGLRTRARCGDAPLRSGTLFSRSARRSGWCAEVRGTARPTSSLPVDTDQAPVGHERDLGESDVRKAARY